ncbi:MAG: DUF1343 domain-containing protein [Cytophagaceae bacterium]|nr:DUF1343 domain-containing protein [Cytophagaceae bacterium]
MVCVSPCIALFALVLQLTACERSGAQAPPKTQRPVLGIEQTARYLPELKGKTVALVVNHTSIFPNKTHLADSLLRLGIRVKTIFAPEHGFRGTATDGEKIVNGTDTRTGLPITSLYGANRKPTPEQLTGIDVVLFDIQDVGARFYTYTSTMHYVMEACAEQGKRCLILDRPNPNGHLVDGPVLEPKFASFVGLNPVPIVHGCTVGELAGMINGQGWLKNGVKCTLSVVKCTDYTHQTPYAPLVGPSPNVPNLQSILLYPSICLLEPTIVSVGRGTDTQFQVIGGPDPALGGYTFTPVDKPGALNPPQEGKKCYGLDLRGVDARKQGFTLKYVLEMYRKATDKTKFFTSTSYFDKLAGTDSLRQQLIAGKSEAEIRQSWQAGLKKYKAIRAKYLLY